MSKPYTGPVRRLELIENLRGYEICFSPFTGNWYVKKDNLTIRAVESYHDGIAFVGMHHHRPPVLVDNAAVRLRQRFHR
jgi:hypothetical protein